MRIPTSCRLAVAPAVAVAVAVALAVASGVTACGSGDLVPIEGPFGAVARADAAGDVVNDLGTGAAVDASAAGGSGACKRGIAANIAPSETLLPTVAWWYNWALHRSGPSTDIEFVPMVWGSGFADDSLPAESRFLLGFNEPSFHSQANLTAQQAAALWPDLEAKARASGAAIVSPGVNFCGPADDCHGTDPYQYLRDFFAACANCKIDYVAVHWYNCDLPSLRDYLEPGGNLEGFEQFGKPIWVTELSCSTSASAADQEAYMRAAIPYLEGNPQVFRYSWFSADPIPNARLMNSDGSPTALGQVYMSLSSNCR